MSLVDPSTFDDNEETRTAAANAASESADSQNQEQPKSGDQTDESVPEKFRGKSAKEIIDSYQSLETELGRARNEIGTNRRLVDELLGLRRSPQEKSRPQPEPVTPQALAENPEQTIVSVAKRVADERVSQNDERLASIEARITERDLTDKYGNFRSTLDSADFQDWAKASRYRVNLIVRASQGDMAAGDEILGLYKETRLAPKETPSEKQEQNLDSVRKVSTAKSGGSGANKVVSTQQAKKTWTRAEITRLYVDNPDEYNRLSDAGEFVSAYEEKRVK